MNHFALLNTKNNAGLIHALGVECELIDEKASTSGTSIDDQTKRSIFEIAERNVMRRKIRFPNFFGFPLVANIYRKIYRRQALAKYNAIYSALSCDTNRTVLIFNGYLAPNALLDLAAKNLKIQRLYLEHGFFPATMQCDVNGINALSTLPRDPSFYNKLSENDLGEGWPRSLTTRKSKLKDSSSTAVSQPLPSRFIFVPFQVPSDMQILALSSWIKDMRHLYDEIYTIAETELDLHFVIKEHPSFPLSIQGNVRKHARIHFHNANVTQDLIEKSDAVITVNSTVGLEAITLGKKVIVMGDAYYGIKGIALRATNAIQLKTAIKNLENWEPDVMLVTKFVRFIYNSFLLPVDMKNPQPNLGEMLKARVEAYDGYSQLIGKKKS